MRWESVYRIAARELGRISFTIFTFVLDISDEQIDQIIRNQPVDFTLQTLLSEDHEQLLVDHRKDTMEDLQGPDGADGPVDVGAIVYDVSDTSSESEEDTDEDESPPVATRRGSGRRRVRFN